MSYNWVHPDDRCGHLIRCYECGSLCSLEAGIDELLNTSGFTYVCFGCRYDEWEREEKEKETL